MANTNKVWAGMKNRCDNPNNSRYADYGGRGISYCDDWRYFKNFLRDMGEAPEGLSLDRIDNDKGYNKQNCRWATREEQQRNTRRSVLTAQMVAVIRQAREESKLSSRELARQLGKIFNVQAGTIREVLKCRTWGQ